MNGRFVPGRDLCNQILTQRPNPTVMASIEPVEPTPVRVVSAHGQPPPTTSIERRCERCGASFLGLAAGKTGKRGLWSDWRWWCSVECAPDKALGLTTPDNTDCPVQP